MEDKMQKSKKYISGLLAISLIACSLPTTSSALFRSQRIRNFLKSRYAVGMAGLTLMMVSRMISFNANQTRQAIGIQYNPMQPNSGNPAIAQLMKKSFYFNALGNALFFLSLKDKFNAFINIMAAILF